MAGDDHAVGGTSTAFDYMIAQSPLGGTAPHIADASGNALASNYSWSFTTGTQQYSLWYPAELSVSTASSDTDSVELATRFTTNQDGSITGIMFYKSMNDQAQHTVTLWDNTGAIMGTATTVSESATSWQVATFAMPITITTGVTYVASYRASVGQYSYTQYAHCPAIRWSVLILISSTKPIV